MCVPKKSCQPVSRILFLYLLPVEASIIYLRLRLHATCYVQPLRLPSDQGIVRAALEADIRELSIRKVYPNPMFYHEKL